MNVKPIRTQKNLREALARIDTIIDAKHGTSEYDELEVLTTLVEAFEAKNHPILPPDPVEAIKFRMDQMGLKQTDIPQNFQDVLNANRFESLAITNAHALQLRNLPDIHRDPFDRIIIAQAQYENLTLITRDTFILSKTHWIAIQKDCSDQ